MKQRSEEVAENAARVLLQTLEQARADTGAVLDMYEDNHDDRECDQSKQYNALVVGFYSLEAAIDQINHQLNKK